MEVLPERVPTRPDDDVTLKVYEVALRLKLAPKTVRKQLAAGTFPCRAIKVGNSWRVIAADLDKLLAVEDGIEAV